MSAVIVISFDIDGTLEISEPPGVVPIALIQTAKRLGYLVGSCSDRPLTYQQAVWERLGIAPDFMVLKHRLADVRRQFSAAAYYHVGDSDTDARYASGAGFRFLEAEPFAHAACAAELFGASG